MEYLSLGKIIDAFGLEGVLKVYSTSNLEENRYKEGAKIFLCNSENNNEEEYTVEYYRKKGVLTFLKLKEINDANNAISKKGYEVHVIKNRDDLEEGSYFYSDLIDCEVYDENGNVLGFVKQIEEFPAQLTFRVGRKGSPDFFVPFINEFVKNIDIDNKKITIHVIEGLL